MNKGKLFLIPAPISGTDLKETLLSKDIEIVSNLRYFIAETPKVARSYLASIELKNKIQKINIETYDEHSDPEDIQHLIQPLLAGDDLGLMTDAGVPCIADPGEKIVFMCHRLNIEVVPLIGPSSIFLSLMASGLDGEKFTFNGYMSRKPHRRKQQLKELQKKIYKNGFTQIIMEAPYRNQVLFNDLLELDDNLNLCLATQVGSEKSTIITQPISVWREKGVSLNKVPIIFIIGK